MDVFIGFFDEFNILLLEYPLFSKTVPTASPVTRLTVVSCVLITVNGWEIGSVEHGPSYCFSMVFLKDLCKYSARISEPFYLVFDNHEEIALLCFFILVVNRCCIDSVHIYLL